MKAPRRKETRARFEVALGVTGARARGRVKTKVKNWPGGVFSLCFSSGAAAAAATLPRREIFESLFIRRLFIFFPFAASNLERKREIIP